jgi:hypothetical protein
MTRAREARSRLPGDRSRLLGLPLPARDEIYNEYEKSVEWRNIFAAELGYLYNEWLPKEVNPIDAFNKLFVPYVANWSFGERVPVLEGQRELQDPTAIGAAYARLATLLVNRLDWYALDTGSSGEELRGTRVELSRARKQAEEYAVRERAERERAEQERAERERLERTAELMRAREAGVRERRRFYMALSAMALAVFAGGAVWLAIQARVSEQEAMSALQRAREQELQARELQQLLRVQDERISELTRLLEARIQERPEGTTVKPPGGESQSVNPSRLQETKAENTP